MKYYNSWGKPVEKAETLSQKDTSSNLVGNIRFNNSYIDNLLF